MSFDTYANLKLAAADWINRADLAPAMSDFVTLAEADMQRRCKLVEFEGTATIPVTGGVGTLPTDWSGARSVYWNGDTPQELKYISPDRFDVERVLGSSSPLWYTISGTTMRFSPTGTGEAVATYNAKFTALSDSNPTNALLLNHPDVYLYGALKQAAIYLKDWAGKDQYEMQMDLAVARVKKHNNDRKYGGATLQVRVGR